MTNKFLRHLNIQIINSDKYIANYVADSDNLSDTDIAAAIETARGANMKLRIAMAGKTVAKRLLISMKDIGMKHSALNRALSFLTPENINEELTLDEYKALVDSKTNTVPTFINSPFLLITTNIAFSLFNNNIAALFQSTDNTHAEKQSAIARAVDKLFDQQPVVEEEIVYEPMSPINQEASVHS